MDRNDFLCLGVIFLSLLAFWSCDSEESENDANDKGSKKVNDDKNGEEINEQPSVAWAKTFKSDKSVYLDGVDVDDSGNIFIVGSIYSDRTSMPVAIDFDGNVASSSPEGGTLAFSVALDEKGTVLWSKKLGRLSWGRDIAAGSDGSVFVSVVDESLSALHLLKLDGTTGDEIWIRSTFAYDIPEKLVVATDSHDNVYISGVLAGYLPTFFELSPSDLIEGEAYQFIVSFSPDGEYRWHQVFGNQEAHSKVHGIAVGESDNVYVISEDYEHDGTAWQGSKILVQSYSKDGEFRWDSSYVSSFNPSGRGCTTDLDNNLYISTGTNIYRYDTATGTEEWSNSSSFEFDKDEALVDSNGYLHVLGGSDFCSVAPNGIEVSRTTPNGWFAYLDLGTDMDRQDPELLVSVFSNSYTVAGVGDKDHNDYYVFLAEINTPR